MTVAAEHGPQFELPAHQRRGDMSVEQAIEERRSQRDYGGSLSLTDVAQLLWAAQGETHPDGFRAVPSAGAK